MLLLSRLPTPRMTMSTPRRRTQKADFTFYGGIYRDVELLIVNKNHFDLDYYGGQGIQITAKPVEGYKKAEVEVKTFTNCEDAVHVRILDAEGKEVAAGDGNTVKVVIDNVRLWNGLEDPYLYTAVASLESGDEVSARFGVRDFHYHAKTGFYLNGRS